VGSISWHTDWLTVSCNVISTWTSSLVFRGFRFDWACPSWSSKEADAVELQRNVLALFQAAILQQTAEYIYQLEQEKTSLLSQNCQLKRLVNQHEGQHEPSSAKKRKVEPASKYFVLTDSASSNAVRFSFARQNVISTSHTQWHLNTQKLHQQLRHTTPRPRNNKIHTH
jgi:hypothetical protein